MGRGAGSLERALRRFPVTGALLAPRFETYITTSANVAQNTLAKIGTFLRRLMSASATGHLSASLISACSSAEQSKFGGQLCV